MGTTPCILGKAVDCTYHRGLNYLEVFGLVFTCMDEGKLSTHKLNELSWSRMIGTWYLMNVFGEVCCSLKYQLSVDVSFLSTVIS